MVSFIVFLILLFLLFVTVEVQKSVFRFTRDELRRRSQKGGKYYKRLYELASYGQTTNLILWTIVIILAALSIVVMHQLVPSWFTFIGVVLFLGVVFAWLPTINSMDFSRRLVKAVSPVFLKIISSLHGPLRRYYKISLLELEQSLPTGIYETEDLIKFLARQQKQKDNHIPKDLLESIKTLVKFNDEPIRRLMHPIGSLKTIESTEAIRPVILDEIHKTEQPFVPVIENDNVIGLIDAGSLSIDLEGLIRDAMQQRLYYVAENSTVQEALDVFSKANYPCIVVTDDTDTPVGFVYLSDILHRLKGDDLDEEVKKQDDKEELPEIRIEPEETEVA